MKLLNSMIGLALLFSLGLPVNQTWAQAVGDDEENGADESLAPEILTSDLGLTTALESDRLTASFVIVDSDNVVEVTINGEAQEFEPGDTVMLSKELVFTETKNVVEVSALDAKGNRRTVQYTAYLPAVDIESERSKTEISIGGKYNVLLSIDSNPSRDLSLPFDVEGVKELGVVKDSEQSDQRRDIQLLGMGRYGDYNALAGLVTTSYAKDENNLYETTVALLGMGYGRVASDQSGFVFNYLFMDINISDFDYAQYHVFSPTWMVKSTDGQGSYSSSYILALTMKDFAESTQDNLNTYSLAWNYLSLDSVKQDSFRLKTRLGTDSESIFVGNNDISRYNYLASKFDWGLKWDSGALLNTGFGLEYRKYPHDKSVLTKEGFGSNRVDVPLSFNLSGGYEFMKSLSTTLDYKYLFNVSNGSPYIKTIIGIGLKGTF